MALDNNPIPPTPPIIGESAPYPAAVPKPHRISLGRIGLIFSATSVVMLGLMFLLRPG